MFDLPLLHWRSIQTQLHLPLRTAGIGIPSMKRIILLAFYSLWAQSGKAVNDFLRSYASSAYLVGSSSDLKTELNRCIDVACSLCKLPYTTPEQVFECDIEGMQQRLSSKQSQIDFHGLLDNADQRKPANGYAPLADFGHQTQLRLRDSTLPEAQMPLRELPRSTYNLTNEPFTAALVHKLGIAPLAFAARRGYGVYAERPGLHCVCGKAVRVDFHPCHG